MSINIDETPHISSAVFLGSKPLGLSVLSCLFKITSNIKWTIIHPNDELDSRSNINAFRDFAKINGLDFVVAESSSVTRNIIYEKKPDIGFVCGWYWLLDSEILNLIKNGLWGMHNSLLPKYRGGSPLVWSILNGDHYVGSTVFKLTEGMDDGEILHQIKIPLEISHDISDALFMIEKIMLKELPKKWKALITNKALLVHQNEHEVSFCGQRIETDGLIDWNKEAKYVHNFIRAQTHPYPCAYTYLLQRKIKILKTKLFNGIYFGTPGQILQRNAQTILVSCGSNTAIEILNLIVEEKEEIPAQCIKSIKYRLSNIPI